MHMDLRENATVPMTTRADAQFTFLGLDSRFCSRLLCDKGTFIHANVYGHKGVHLAWK